MREYQMNSWDTWLKNNWSTWLLPFIGPLTLILVFEPCILRQISSLLQDCFHSFINQSVAEVMLPHSRSQYQALQLAEPTSFCHTPGWPSTTRSHRPHPYSIKQKAGMLGPRGPYPLPLVWVLDLATSGLAMAACPHPVSLD